MCVHMALCGQLADKLDVYCIITAIIIVIVTIIVTIIIAIIN